MELIKWIRWNGHVIRKKNHRKLMRWPCRSRRLLSSVRGLRHHHVISTKDDSAFATCTVSISLFYFRLYPCGCTEGRVGPQAHKWGYKRMCNVVLIRGVWCVWETLTVIHIFDLWLFFFINNNIMLFNISRLL